MSLPARFSDRYGPWALVAGASDGIGEAFAHRLAGAGINVVLVARRAAVLAKLADELGRGYGVDARCVVADLTSEAMMGEIRQATDDIEVGLLVYNAGAAHGAVHFLDRPAEAAIGMIALNCRGPVLLAHHFGKLMRERRRGGIMLLSSMAAMSGGSYIAVYNATKSFDMVLAEGLWHELNPVGVDAMCLVVGATLTPSMLASRETFRSYPNIMQPLDVVDRCGSLVITTAPWLPPCARDPASTPSTTSATPQRPFTACLRCRSPARTSTPERVAFPGIGPETRWNRK
jgi:short-subunit dehydrogenase